MPITFSGPVDRQPLTTEPEQGVFSGQGGTSSGSRGDTGPHPHMACCHASGMSLTSSPLLSLLPRWGGVLVLLVVF